MKVVLIFIVCLFGCESVIIPPAIVSVKINNISTNLTYAVGRLENNGAGKKKATIEAKVDSLTLLFIIPDFKSNTYSYSFADNKVTCDITIGSSNDKAIEGDFVIKTVREVSTDFLKIEGTFSFQTQGSLSFTDGTFSQLAVVK